MNKEIHLRMVSGTLTQADHLVLEKQTTAPSRQHYRTTSSQPPPPPKRSRETNNDVRDAEAAEQTAKRAAQLKEKQKREQKKKREESTQNDLAKELRGTLDIGAMFKTGKKIERFPSFKPPLTIKKPTAAAAAAAATPPPAKTLARLPLPPPPPTPVIVVARTEFESAAEGDELIYDLDDARLSEAERRQMVRLLRLHETLRFDCGDQPECYLAEHRHESDSTALGRHWHAHKTTLTDVRAPPYETAPIDPFTSSAFPLTKYVSGYDAAAEQKIERRDSRTTTTAAKLMSNTLIKSLVAIRNLYHTMRRNLDATRDEKLAEIAERHEPAIIKAHVTEQFNLEENCIRGRDIEVESTNLAHYGGIVALDQHVINAVQDVVRGFGRQKFRLPEMTLCKALVDIVRLESGLAHDEVFFVQMFAEAAGGSVESLEAEKQRIRDVQKLQALRSVNIELEPIPTLFTPAPSRPPPPSDEMQEDDDSVQLVEPITRKGGPARMPPPRLPPPPPPPPPPDERNHPTPPSSPPPALNGGGGGGDVVPTLELKPGVLLKAPCVSQFIYPDAGHACTAIAFAAAMRLATAAMQYDHTTDEQVMQHINWLEVVKKGASVWRPWRNARALLPPDPATGLPQSTFMMAVEVARSASWVLPLAHYKISSEEFSGPLHGASMIGVNNGGDTPAASTPTLEQAFERVLKRSPAAFGAVISVSATSLAVGAQAGVFYLFDSHGIHFSGFSSLMRFATLALLIDTIRSIFPERIVDDECEGNEMRRLTRNTYALFALYPAPVDPNRMN